MTTLCSMKDIKHALYINLEERIDRNSQVQDELRKIGIQNIQRFNAIKLRHPALGCSYSHLACLEIAKINNWDHVFICEDDIFFLDTDVFVRQLNGFLTNVETWDVILVAGNNIKDYTITNEYSAKVTWCQTATGYIVKQEYYDTLINNYKNGIARLRISKNLHPIYAIDVYWRKLQKKDNWYLITPLSVVQREGYSDIEKRVTNYEKMMTVLDKSMMPQINEK